MRTLPTWAKRSKFCYSGSVTEGTTITYGKGFRLTVSSSQYSELLKHFRGRTVDIGTSRTNRSPGSVGEWLQSHITKTAIASYIGPILIAEGYAERVDEPKIKFQ